FASVDRGQDPVGLAEPELLLQLGNGEEDGVRHRRRPPRPARAWDGRPAAVGSSSRKARSARRSRITRRDGLAKPGPNRTGTRTSSASKAYLKTVLTRWTKFPIAVGPYRLAWALCSRAKSSV